MKPLWKLLWLFVYLLFFNFISGSSQCTNTLQSITYDTVIIGTGNNTHSIVLSQFDPSIGTLISANINSTISVNYGFSLKNVESVQRDFSVSVGRYDYFSSAALNSPYSNLIDTSIGNYILNPGDSVSKAPYTILYRYKQNDSITSNVVDFLGSNSISFNYKPITYTNLTGSNVYYYSATASDTIHFSITYYYCSNAILQNWLNSFSAEKENNEFIKLLWSTSAQQSGITYEVQKSDDSSKFISVGMVKESLDLSNYSYHYKIVPTDKDKIYFRLKIITSSGAIIYSEIKAVDIFNENASKNFLYPNPCKDYVNIHLQQGSWNIKIFTAIGTLIEQHHFLNSSLAHIDFQNRLSRGSYFIQVQDIISSKKMIFEFIIE